MAQGYPRGSEWRKWDLHVHTPLSFLNNNFPKNTDGSANWEPYLEKLERSDISVLGVTDYFSLEGYKALREFKERGRLKNIHTLLPNVEFRLEQQITRRETQVPHRVNFHVILSDMLDPQLIEDQFLGNIDFWYEAEPQKGDNLLRVTKDNLIALGNKLIEENPGAYSGRSPLDVGASSAVVDHKLISRILSSDPRFRGKYLVVLPDSDLSLIAWQSEYHSIRTVLLSKADLVFSSNQKMREWCLGKTPYEGGSDQFIREFKSLKPCIHGSDAHDVDRIGVPCGKRGERGHSCSDPDQECDLRFCWIKADPSFEGLRQILYEPECRVRIQANNPTVAKSLHTLSEIKIDGAEINEELTVGDTSIPLNQDLVAIAGGKGTGKTAFVDLLANCFMDRVHTKDPNSFVARISEYDPNITVFIEFANSVTFKKSIKESRIFEDDEIIYIPQAALEAYVGESSDLTQHIDSLIMNSPLVVDTVLKFDYTKLASQVREILEKLAATNKQIEDLEKRADEEREKELEKVLKRQQAELGDVLKRIEEAEKKLSQESADAAKAVQKKLSNLRSKLALLEEQQRLMKEALEFLEQRVPKFNEVVKEINANLRELGREEQVDEYAYLAKDILIQLKETMEKEATKAANDIEKQTKELKEKAADVAQQARRLDQRKQFEAAIKKLKGELAAFSDLRKGLGEGKKKRHTLMADLLTAVLDRSKKYREIIARFSEGRDRVLVDLSFEPEVLFREEELLENAEQILDNRRAVVREIQDRPSDLGEYVRLSGRVAEEHEDEIEALVSEAERLAEAFKKKLKRGTVVGSRALYGLLFKNYFKVRPRVKYKNVVLEKCSLGQKATVLIKIHLAEGTKPIVIDSHDDHLDNEFIMEELVGAIRQAKEYRQVILVSNNGNVVVNSDAEQAIVAERQGTTITYAAGSIENPGMRHRLLRVLEGGEKAFRQRQHKYRLNG